MAAIDDLLARNAEYAQAHRALPDGTPSRRVAVVTCMDARINVYAAFGLEPGEAHVIRNAGGVLTDDVVRSLAISQRMLGTEEVMVVHHTRCGVQGLDEEALLAQLEAEAGARPSWRPGTFADAAADVREAVAALQSSPYLAHTDRIRGFVIDVETGLLQPV